MIGLFLFGLAVTLVAGTFFMPEDEGAEPLPADGPSDGWDAQTAANPEPSLSMIGGLSDVASSDGTLGGAEQAHPSRQLDVIETLFAEDPLSGSSWYEEFDKSTEELNAMAEERGADGLLFIAGADGQPVADLKIGSSGGDFLSTGPGNDTLLGRGGSDTLLGGDGDDVIDDGDRASSGADDIDIIHAGSGDDHITIRGGLNLLSLGDGRDVVVIHPAEDANADRAETGVVISDFDVQLDRLELHLEGEHPALGPDQPGYRLTSVTTSAGEGTLVEPISGMNVSISDGGAEGMPGRFALLLGVHPHELSDSNIWVLRADEVPYTLSGLR